MRVREPAESLPTSFDTNFEAARDLDHTVSGVSDNMSVNVTDHNLDPSRLPPAQRQLFMRIQQKQHRDDANSKPISELTAKCEILYYFGFYS